jgi:hypothetical protein
LKDFLKISVRVFDGIIFDYSDNRDTQHNTVGIFNSIKVLIRFLMVGNLPAAVDETDDDVGGLGR